MTLKKTMPIIKPDFPQASDVTIRYRMLQQQREESMLSHIITTSRYGHIGNRSVTYVDSTGARILADIEAELARRGIALALVLSEQSETIERLADFGDPNSEGRVFPDIDRAITVIEALLAGLDRRSAPV